MLNKVINIIDAKKVASFSQIHNNKSPLSLDCKKVYFNFKILQSQKSITDNIADLDSKRLYYAPYPSLDSIIDNDNAIKDSLSSNYFNLNSSVPVFRSSAIQSLQFIILTECKSTSLPLRVLVLKHCLKFDFSQIRSENESIKRLLDIFYTISTLPELIPKDYNSAELEDSLPALSEYQFSTFLTKMSLEVGIEVDRAFESTEFEFSSKKDVDVFIDKTSSHPIEQLASAFERTLDVFDKEIRTDEFISAPSDPEETLFGNIDHLCKLIPAEWIRDPADAMALEEEFENSNIKDDPNAVICMAYPANGCFKLYCGVMLLMHKFMNAINVTKKSKLLTGAKNIDILNSAATELDEDPDYTPSIDSSSSDVSEIFYEVD